MKLGDYDEQELIKQAKLKMYEPEQHSFYRIKWPVRHLGKDFLVEFKKVTLDAGEVKWSLVKVHVVKGSLKFPKTMLY